MAQRAVTCDLVKRPAGEAALRARRRTQRAGAGRPRAGRRRGERALVVVPRRSRRGAARAPRPLPRDGRRRDGAGRRRASRRGCCTGRARAAVSRPRAQRGRPAASLDRTGLGGAFVLVARGSTRPSVRRASRQRSRRRGGRDGDARVGGAAPRARRCRGSASTSTTRRTRKRPRSRRSAVSFDKGCYLGQEVVCMLEMRGHVKRKLVVARPRGRGAAARGARRDRRGGAAVGEVTSAALSPTLGEPVGARDGQARASRRRARAWWSDGALRESGRPAGVRV